MDIRNFGQKSIDEVKASCSRWASRSRTALPDSIPQLPSRSTTTTMLPTPKTSSSNPPTVTLLVRKPHRLQLENDMPTPTKGPRLGVALRTNG